MATRSTSVGTLIHSRDSPYARRVRIVLAELGLPYASQLHPTVYAIPDLEALAPTLRVPVWQDDHGTVFDSGLIVEYLLSRYGTPDSGGGSVPGGGSAPGDSAPGSGPPPGDAYASGGALPPLARALRRPEHPWADGKLLATLGDLMDAGFLLRQLALSGVEEEHVRYLQRVRQRIASALNWLEGRATPAGFVPGTFSLPDVWLVCALAWAEFRGTYAWRGRPTLEALMARLATRPSVAETAHEAWQLRKNHCTRGS
jgi:glutathione S-transferase